ncbi:uncharacterized protein IL334_007593 [Kwoniella shivajii]|uniref:Glucose-methanol-choline oxidoreductase N-terminal domain-containing protein n=1 Tax=Kwoniella shivajii TaxID=564305 RepID=A0ABZ1DB83_9TREE|nr:hypothetical protein IL334_007593 [Kwoniella shivajii]
MSRYPNEVDIIICGGGGAGCILASRLAEELPRLQILLIERGGDDREVKRLERPLDSLFWLFSDNPYLQWLECEGQDELKGRKPRIPVGNILGGGTSINTLMYNTGAASDYDDWNQPGWSFEDMKPLIKKSVDYDVPLRDPSKDVHTRGGAFGVSLGGHQMTWGNDFCETWKEVRPDMEILDSITTYRHGNAVGRQPKMITGQGRRSTVAEAYLHKRQSPLKNLAVVTGLTVSRTIVEGGRAVGVEVLESAPYAGKEKSRKVIKARKLVVLACGALGSPGILERSGLGDPNVLTKAGVEVLADLPGVGRELDDHQLVCPMYHISDDIDSFDDYARGVESIKTAVDEEWERTGKGIGASNGFDWGYKIRPNAEEIDKMGSTFKDYWKRVGADKPDKALYSNVIFPYFYSYKPRPKEGKYMCIGGFHNYPASRGSIHITSSDPFLSPRVNAGLLNHPADMPVHIWHYKIQREVVRRLPFYRGELAGCHPNFDETSNARLRSPGEFSDPAEVIAQAKSVSRIEYSAEDDQKIDEWVRDSVATAYHTMSTCPMRKREDEGVVDARLDVYGVKGLKVADLSICPSNVGSNTTSVVLLIAEKAVNLIVEEMNGGIAPITEWVKSKL